MTTLTSSFKSEKQTKFTNRFKANYEHQLDYNDNISVDSILSAFDSIINIEELPLKCGRGGSHVWVSDMNNERILIVEFK